MKFIVLLLALAASISARTINEARIGHDSPALETVRSRLPNEHAERFGEFIGFMRDFEKRYQTVDEAHLRASVFFENLQRVADMQSREGGTAEHGVTQFFDLTLDEFQQMYANLKLSHEKRASNSGEHAFSESDLARYAALELPASVDWRDRGFVTAVKNQAHCGSCYVFASIAAVEGQWFRKTGKLIQFSEEQILDCDWGLGGCGGGDPLNVYIAIAELGGLETEQDYPYTADKGKISRCGENESKFVGYVNASRAIPTHDELLLAKILSAEGPIEINIDANYLFGYKSGIIDPTDQLAGSHPERVNHAVLLVGYGTEKGVDYWLLKNSWSERFGEKGYFRVKRGTDRLYLVDTNPSLPIIY